MDILAGAPACRQAAMAMEAILFIHPAGWRVVIAMATAGF
jgi:hypothetical protein